MGLNPNDLASYQRLGDRNGKTGFSSEASGEHAMFQGIVGDGRRKVQMFEFELASLAAVSTDIGRNITGLITNVILEIMTLVVAGGTSVKVGVGPAADPDKYGITGDLLKNTKITKQIIPTAVVASAAEDIKINMCATAGGIGDTAATAGKVRCTIYYEELGAYADTP